jgi:hypothetical protein
MESSADPFGVFVYLVAASRMVFDESQMHASTRLIEAAGRTAGLAQGKDEFLEKLRAEIETQKWRTIDDHEGYIAWLEGALRRIASEAQRRNAAHHATTNEVR